jgi:predicted GTPase
MFDINALFEEFKKAGIDIDDSQKQKISEQIEQVLNYEPRVGFFGKTGAGKSSLCNALFGRDTYRINDVAACTRDVQEEILRFGDGGKGIKLVDVPGVGESSKRDVEYSKLYNRLLPELDLVLWLIKVDDRAISIDLNFYENIVKPHIQQGKPFFFIISQVDKIEPCREWNSAENKPSTQQQNNIIAKCKSIASKFACSESLIIPVSAQEKFNLNYLVQQIIFELPKEKRHTVYREIPQEYHDQNTDAVVEKSFIETIGEIIDGVIQVGKFVIEKVIPVISTAIEKIFGFFF